jgi:hypothetical protein
MGVRKTETRLPEGLQAADLGEAVVAADSRCALVSYITSPLAINRENTYVVFVTDNALAGTVEQYEWTFTEEGSPPVTNNTDIGQASYTPVTAASLSISVKLSDGGSAEQATLSLTQQIGPLNNILEGLISAAVDTPGAGIGNPDVLREIINDFNPYYLNFALQQPESGDSFKKFLFGTISEGCIQRKPDSRNQQLDKLAEAINSGDEDYVSAIACGLGVSNLRLGLVAMMLPPSSVPFTELPDGNAENLSADEQVRQLVAALPEEDRIDWYNNLRFPKSNINTCGKLLEALRNKFFNGVSFDDVLNKQSGVMSTWIIQNYNRGPLHHD